MSTLFLILLFTTLATSTPVAWIGAVTPNSFVAHIDIQPTDTQLILSTDPQFSTIISSLNVSASEALLQPQNVYNPLRKFSFPDLQPLTKYYIATRSQGIDTLRASVTTFPEENSNSDVVIALSSCQFGASKDNAFQDIQEWHQDVQSAQPNAAFLMLHMGDMHYANINANEVTKFENAIRDVLTRPRVNSVFSNMPVAYMYDDHDYGSNNAGFSSPSRPAALTNFRTMIPNYPLQSNDASFYAFTVASVRFIITDLRAKSRKFPESTMGDGQREWFFEQLANAQDYQVVVWMSSKPWIGAEQLGSDSWRGFPSERRLISNRIADLNITNLVVVSGDAHMLAADNGTHSDYSDSDKPPAGFPVFQAAPLANIGSTKGGGPYTEGCSAYRFFQNRQYGILNITEVGTENGPCVEFSGFRSGDREKKQISFKKCGQLGGVDGRGRQLSTCSIPPFPAWVLVLIIFGILLAIAVIVVLVLLFRRRRTRKKEQAADVKDNDERLSSANQNADAVTEQTAGKAGSSGHSGQSSESKPSESDQDNVQSDRRI